MTADRPVRQAFSETLLSLAKTDPRIFALTTDSRGSVTLDAFAAELPEQFVECGIAEQDAVGMAAGLANAGLHPFVCSPACFLALRAAEQIKLDVGYSKSNVKLIGVSGGVSYGALGSTHHATQDIALLRTFPNLDIILPADVNQMIACTKALVSSNHATYVRIGRGAVPSVYGENPPFTIGKASKLRNGKGCAIIACGEMVFPALQAAERLGAALYDMHTIRPLDMDAVHEATEYGTILTVEEHCVFGGLGSAVAESVVQHRPVPMRILGLPSQSLYHGSSADIKKHFGLTAPGIEKAARELMG